MRTLIAAGAIIFCLSSEVSANDATQWSVASQQVGPLRTNMTEAEVEALGFDVVRDETTLWEGERTLILRVSLEDEQVEAWFYEGRVEMLVTRSTRFATLEGGRVSMTLAELRVSYPQGRVAIGLEEGGYFNFIAPDGVSFRMDQEGVADSCYAWRASCDLSHQQARAIAVRRR